MATAGQAGTRDPVRPMRPGLIGSRFAEKIVQNPMIGVFAKTGGEGAAGYTDWRNMFDKHARI